MVLKFDVFSYLSGWFFGLSSSIEFDALSLMLSLRVGI